MAKKVAPTLTSELLKAARLGNIQNGLPPILKAAPTVAILAGSIVAHATGGPNLAEERLLGATEGVISLGEPVKVMGLRSGARVGGSEGVRRMCLSCGQLDQGKLMIKRHALNATGFEGLWIKEHLIESRGRLRNGLLDGKPHW